MTRRPFSSRDAGPSAPGPESPAPPRADEAAAGAVSPAPASSRETADPTTWARPWVQLKYLSFSPQLYPAMIRAASPDAAPGSLVTVYDKEGRRFGAGLYHPRARVPLRVFHHGEAPFREADFLALPDRAVALRLEMLRLPEVTEAFRVVHSDGDGLSGLIVDRYADVLSVEVHSLGIWQRLPQWLPHLHARLGTRHAVVEVSEFAARVEGALFHTQGGLAVTPEGQVKRPGGGRFPNLFAAGGAARGLSGPGASGYIAGNGLLSATGLGRLAGAAAARLAQGEARETAA